MILSLMFQISRTATNRFNVSVKSCGYRKELKCDRYPFCRIGSDLTSV
jgi:hypothetical protein